MGREIKRVPLDFNWPLEERWKGFVRPNNGKAPCTHCVYDIELFSHARPTGYSRLGYALYASQDKLSSSVNDLRPGEARFLAALEAKMAPGYRKRRQKEDVAYCKISGHVDRGFAMFDMLRLLAKTLRVPFKETFFCPTCKGTCAIVVDRSQNNRHNGWKRKQPPKGEGWQVWETVSEGSPITPVFATPEELVEYLCTVGTTWDQKRIAEGRQRGLPTREQALAFVNAGWTPSGVLTKNGMVTGIAVAEALAEGAE